jgi:hypothetical protein
MFDSKNNENNYINLNYHYHFIHFYKLPKSDRIVTKSMPENPPHQDHSAINVC